MYKIFRDSLFNPKKLINYRFRSGWNIALYLILLLLFGGLCSIIPLFSFKEISSVDKISFINSFENTDAYLSDYIYHSSQDITVKIEGYTVKFIDQAREIKESMLTADFYVYNGSLYAYAIFKMDKILDLKDVSIHFENIFLSSINENSELFLGINELIKQYKPVYIVSTFFMFIMGEFGLLMLLTVMSYLFCIGIYKMKYYIPKGQLFKILIISYTSTILAESLVALLPFKLGIFEYILMFMSLIPSLIVEREMLKKIRIYQYKNNLLSDPILKESIKELLEREEDNNKNKEEENNE